MLPYQTVSRKEDGIVIVGLGGAGANILQRFRGSSAENVRLCIMSLDERLGREVGNVEFLQLGAGLNHGLGSGGDPEVGRLAMEESREDIAALLENARLLVMVVGLGGGTGSGVAPLLAELASKAGVFLVSVLVMPFGFEGHRRREQADRALEKISSVSDLVFCFENDYMEELFRTRNGAMAVFEETNSLLSQATASIPMLANSPGIINIGLDELVTALRNNDSRCIYGSGTGYGPHRAEDAARAALESPLVAFHNALALAHTVIVHIAGGNNMSLSELRTVMEMIRSSLGHEHVNVFFGAAVKPRLGEEIRVSLIASVDDGELRAAIAEEEAEAEQLQADIPAAEEKPVETAVEEIPEEDEESVEEPEEESEIGEDIFANEEEEEPVSPAPQRYTPEPRPSVSTELPRPEPRPSMRPEPPRPEPRPIMRPEPPRPEPRPIMRPEPLRPEPRPSMRPEPLRPEPRPSMRPEPLRPAVSPSEMRTVEPASAFVSPRSGRAESSLFDGSASQGFFDLDGQSVQGTLPKDSEDEMDERVRNLFSDDAPHVFPVSSGHFSPESARRRRAPEDADEEKDFALRYNDLRDMFPE